MSDAVKVYVLVKQGLENEFQRVMGVYPTIEQVRARVDKIAKANAKYPMRTIKADSFWCVGPTEDEGFFGNSPIYLSCSESTYYPVAPTIFIQDKAPS